MKNKKQKENWEICAYIKIKQGNADLTFIFTFLEESQENLC